MTGIMFSPPPRPPESLAANCPTIFSKQKLRPSSSGGMMCGGRTLKSDVFYMQIQEGLDEIYIFYARVSPELFVLQLDHLHPAYLLIQMLIKY